LGRHQPIEGHQPSSPAAPSAGLLCTHSPTHSCHSRLPRASSSSPVSISGFSSCPLLDAQATQVLTSRSPDTSFSGGEHGPGIYLGSSEISVRCQPRQSARARCISAGLLAARAVPASNHCRTGPPTAAQSQPRATIWRALNPRRCTVAASSLHRQRSQTAQTDQTNLLLWSQG
jgi:hypothetical protein